MASLKISMFIVISLLFISNNGFCQNSNTGGLEGYEIGVQADIDNLPRVKQILVSPPFIPKHEQVATGSPKIVEIEFIIEEKEIEVAPNAFIQAMTFFLNSGNASFPLLSIKAAALSTRALICFACSDCGSGVAENPGKASRNTTQKEIKMLPYSAFLFIGNVPF